MLLSIVIPAYNEEKRISRMLEEYLAFYRQENVEFIVVLNGCRDNTKNIMQSFIEQEKGKVRMVEIPEAIGKGGAVRQGFQVAQGDYLGFVDADGATEPREFDKLVKLLDGRDGVIASRWKRGSMVIGRNFFRKFVSFGFILFVKALFWMPYADTQCGAKVFKKEAVKNVLSQLKVNNMAFDVELLYRLRKGGFRIVEVPTVWIDKSSSAMLGSPWRVISSSVKMMAILLSLRFSK